MATKARQQYFADENSLQKISREFSIADEVQQKIDGIEDGAQVNVIETVKVNGTALVPDEDKAVDVTVPEVIDSLSSTSTDDALSAYQGKVLYDYITNIGSRGRYLSNWNSATGLAVTNPEEDPYEYKAGDYYSVSNVAGSGGTNYRPSGTQYIIGQASTVVETEDVSVSDLYLYDGTTWLLLGNSGRTIAIDSSLSTTSTNPVENRVITNALNGKADATDVNTKTFYLSSTSDLTTAQEAYDWCMSGKQALISYGYATAIYVYAPNQSSATSVRFLQSGHAISYDASTSSLNYTRITLNASNGVVTSISTSAFSSGYFLDANQNYSTPYTPLYNGSPATKKYVDDKSTIVSASQPSTATEGMLRYDTTNDKLKSYDGTNWNEAGSESNTKTFIITGTTGTANIAAMQEAIDWLSADKTPIIYYNNPGYLSYGFYTCIYKDSSIVKFQRNSSFLDAAAIQLLSINRAILTIYLSNGTVTSANYASSDKSVLATDNTTSYTPTADYHPATKKYVDDSISAISITPAWGDITGTLADQTDLQAALDAKQDLLTAGRNIDLTNDVANLKLIEVEVTTAYNTANKIGTTTGGNYTPTVGDLLLVNFVNGCSVYSPTIDIDGSGAKYIMVGGERATSLSFPCGSTSGINTKIIMYYDGTYYRSYGMFAGYGSMSQAEIEAGTSTSNRVITPARLKYAIEYWDKDQVSDDTYSVAWDGVTGIAPSQNAVYDKINSMDTAIAGKQDTLTAGSNISISGNTISATDTTYNAGEGIEIGDIQDYSAMQGPAPSGYHVPLSSEWVALYNVGVSLGVRTSSDGDSVKTYLKMPMAGYRETFSAAYLYQGDRANYWSSTRYSESHSYSLYFTSTALSAQSASYRANGYSLRCFKDSPVIPDSSWTALYQGTGSAGIFRSSSLGLISLSSDGTNWITIQDKNLGATTVYNDGDTLSEANCGKYYQWGNNYGFAWTGSVTTSSTKVDASAYGPGNYYSSSTFITVSASPYDWSSVQNDNLWGGVTGVVTLNNAITNTGVLSVNGETGDVTVEESNTKTFYLSSTSDLTNAQAAYDWYLAGKNPIVVYNNWTYVPNGYGSSFLRLVSNSNTKISTTNGDYFASNDLRFYYDSNNAITNIDTGSVANGPIFLSTTYNSTYSPTQPGNPATKQYVDDKVSDTAYASSWNGVTGIAPSKNAVYDKISSMDSAINALSDLKMIHKPYAGGWAIGDDWSDVADVCDAGNTVILYDGANTGYLITDSAIGSTESIITVVVGEETYKVTLDSNYKINTIDIVGGLRKFDIPISEATASTDVTNLVKYLDKGGNAYIHDTLATLDWYIGWYGNHNIYLFSCTYGYVYMLQFTFTQSGINWYAGTPTSNNVYEFFNPSNAGSTGQVLTKTAAGYNWADSGGITKIFSLSGTGSGATVLAEAQAAYDWYAASKEPIVDYNQRRYHLTRMDSTYLYFTTDYVWSADYRYAKSLKFTLSSGSVTAVTLYEKTIQVTTSVPSSGDANTIYFVK